MNNITWTIIAEEDPDTGELILPIPPEAIAAAGWEEGDTLQWIANPDGSWTLEKDE